MHEEQEKKEIINEVEDTNVAVARKEIKKWKKTAEAVKKLEEAASMDMNVEESCLWANISKQTYYTWIKEDLKLKDRLDELHATPILKAKSIVFEKMGESYQNAMDYLKRKRKKEFGDNVDMTSDGEKMPCLLVKFSDGKTNNNGNTEGV